MQKNKSSIKETEFHYNYYSFNECIYDILIKSFRTRKSEYVFYSSQFLVQMFIPIAFVLFFHHHVNNDAYFLKRGVSIYYLISEKKVEQKVTQKNFNQHVIPENLR